MSKAKTLNIVFFSSSQFTIPLLQKLQTISNKTLESLHRENLDKLSNINFNYKIDQDKVAKILQKYGEYRLNLDFVISAGDKINRDKIISNPIVSYAKNNQLKFSNPLKLKDSFDEIKALNPNLGLGIVASYGQILTTEILASFEFGIINWHPSLLPKYRGPTPMQTILASGDTTTGLSWINMTKGMDSGDVLIQTQDILPQTFDIESLSQNMVEIGVATLILGIITNLGYKDPSLNLEIGQQQDQSQITFTKMLTKEDRIIKPLELTAQQIRSHFKAYKQFPGTAFYDNYFKQMLKIVNLGEIKINIQSSEIIFETQNFIQTKTGTQKQVCLKTLNNYLEIKEILLENGKKLQLNGYQFKPN